MASSSSQQVALLSSKGFGSVLEVGGSLEVAAPWRDFVAPSRRRWTEATKSRSDLIYVTSNTFGLLPSLVLEAPHAAVNGAQRRRRSGFGQNSHNRSVNSLHFSFCRQPAGEQMQIEAKKWHENTIKVGKLGVTDSSDFDWNSKSVSYKTSCGSRKSNQDSCYFSFHFFNCVL